MSDPTPNRAPSDRRRSNWSRRYPPLITLAISLIITLVVLPSALTLPNANPTTVLEYAPVPPEKDQPPPPPEGQISQLGLGTSSSLASATQEDQLAAPVDKGGGQGRKPVTKRCVGKPLRQSEDPNAPPCVAYYESDNGGNTWQGVTRDEITVLVYASQVSVIGGGYAAENPPPAGSYCDVDGPPNTDDNCLDGQTGTQDHFEARETRAMSRYFNDRFQTYNRHVHFWVYYSGAATPQGRRADAADNFDRLKPFAVIDDAIFNGYNDVYAEAIARRGVMVFGSYAMLAGEFFRKNSPYVWGFWPDLQHRADQYVDYVCRKLAPFPNAIHAGGALQNRPRKYATLWANDPQYPTLKAFADQAKRGLQNCPNGAKLNIVEDGSFPHHQYAIDSSPSEASAAQQNVARFANAGVTTVLWLGGYETQTTKAATNQNWLPEWVVAGDLLHDQAEESQYQDQTAWAHAWLASNTLLEERLEDSPCRQAYQETDPGGQDAGNVCGIYRSFFQLFKSIQVAGPNLTPFSVDQGQHAIQRQASQDPHTAACFYDSNDYTCVKDQNEQWWDPNAPDPSGNANQRGCWRVVRGGQRYLPGNWEGTDADVFANPNDPCNFYTDNNVQINADRPS